MMARGPVISVRARDPRVKAVTAGVRRNNVVGRIACDDLYKEASG
jgi:hypothetical protein